MANQAVDPAAKFEADLWELGALAGTGLARNDDNLMIANRGMDLLDPLGNRQFMRIGNRDNVGRPGRLEHTSAPCSRSGATLVHLTSIDEIRPPSVDVFIFAPGMFVRLATPTVAYVKAVADDLGGDDPLARAATIAEATVSRALRNLPHVRPEVRQRVRDVATMLSYVADPNASRLASGRTKTVGLIAPQLNTWYVNLVSAGIEDVLQPADHDLLISALSTPDRRRDLLAGSTNLNQRVDGVVVVDAFLGTSWKRGRGERPMVIIGEKIEGEHTLGIDDEHGAYIAALHLIGLGHTRIAVVGSANSRTRFSPVTKLRLRGFRRAMEERDIWSATELAGDYTIQSGVAAGRALFAIDAAVRPTAVFCLSDEMAFGLLQAAREAGVDVPGQLAVVGFDDHSTAEAFGLTTVRQPVRDMGRRAAERMLAVIEHGPANASHETFDVELMVRSSSTR
jgi:LacI family transcriptional regulator, repressor for deo operon, udp, cdd, tsx, nupC, and nupG